MDARQYIIREAIEEQRQIFGAEMPDRQWILSGWDTWERNPYYHGEEQQHPEDDQPHEQWLEHQKWLANLKKEVRVENVEEVGNDDCPF